MTAGRPGPGVVRLPTGLRVRGCRLADADGTADLTLALGRGRVPDPADRARRGERVQVACRGGVGRTGTALAALAVLDGLEPAQAAAWVRRHYHRRAVETPWQRWWLTRLPA